MSEHTAECHVVQHLDFVCAHGEFPHAAHELERADWQSAPARAQNSFCLTRQNERKSHE
jgi:hypothetical protein